MLFQVVLLVCVSIVLGQDGNSRVNAGESLDGICKPGLRFQENAGCDDINECIEIQPCKSDQWCRNLWGSYLCVCPNGYKLDEESGECMDIDECAIGYCGSGEKCINTVGSFDCACSSGLTKIGRFCRDINECKDHPCANNQYCINTRGSFKCRCEAGYTDMLDGTCTDTDECLQGMCSATGETCQNTQGGYECLCSEGYTKTGNGRYCTDVNECDLDMCTDNSECINTHGSFYCRCHRGFTKVNGICMDNQDCSLGEGTKCQWNCQNMPGTFQCVCPSGYDRLDFACIDKNECDLNNRLCGHGNMCINTHGGHKCVAPAPCPSKTFYRKLMKTDEFTYSQVITNTCNRKRCRKVAGGDMYADCKAMPLSVSQHYVDITSGLVGPKDLLKMRFPARRRRQQYNFSIVEGDTTMFSLRQPSMYKPHAYLMLAGTSSGPAQYQVKVDMSTYNRKGQMRDNRMLAITVYVSEYEF